MPIDTQDERMSIMGWQSYALPLAHSQFDKEDRMMVLGLPSTDIAAVRVSYFGASSVSDDTAVTSYIDPTTLVTVLQSDNPDTYFDSTNKVSKVMVFYRDPGQRQENRIVHSGTGLSGITSWSPGARDGTWEKFRVIAFDPNGARHDLNRAVIGTGEDITHSDGTMTLNT